MKEILKQKNHTTAKTLTAGALVLAITAAVFAQEKPSTQTSTPADATTSGQAGRRDS